ncbi:ATP-dependent DNA ligase [Nocardioides sp. JQ2195]|uniref:ATP-dependent DNA ligase n=1 Tax=Nocardioides sp. JQ2195 TaxID=2592334 RepID=UPI00143E2122|nr:ATP-dependent DNA ligase [Nocardioides sp. JQ2195]QIX26863.1 ATP-dependent DNA ligase [Nocardioides sp. JQ2195]
MQLESVIRTSQAVAATRSRNEKVAAVAAALTAAADSGASVEVVADYLAGVLPQRRIGVSWRGLASLPPAATDSTLSVADVDAALSSIGALSGSGSTAGRATAVTQLFSRATEPEQQWLRALITGEMRQGASDGVLLKAIAQAAAVPEEAVRRGVMLAGFAGPVARIALGGGEPALLEVRLEVGRPLRPMLAASAPDVAAAVTGPVALDSKLDGIRIQAHVASGSVRLFTRTLEDVTDRLPEVVAAVRALPVREAVLDGEVIAETDGRPAPFQVTGSRTMSSADPDRMAAEIPLSTYFFDLLHLDGRDLVDAPAHERWTHLEQVAPAHVVPRVLTDSVPEAEAFFAERLAAGHEGVVVKDPAAPYAAGRRGAGWVKVKPRHTLDLVVLAVEWGSGRRRGLLSNIHLGAHDAATGELVMLGKTFKGMTDQMLAWQTERFLELETHREGHVVFVRPEQVVEIAFDGVQTSRRYPGGVALRFARVLRYRDDKPVAEIDTLDAVRALG